MKEICDEVLGQLVAAEALTEAQSLHLATCKCCKDRLGLLRSLEGRRVTRTQKYRDQEPQIARFRQADRQRLRQGLGLVLLMGFGALAFYASEPQTQTVDIFAALDEGFAGSQQDIHADAPPGTELLPYFEPAALPLDLHNSDDLLPDWSL